MSQLSLKDVTMPENADIRKRKRNPNWDDQEKVLLRECLKEKLDIVENKCTDTNTNNSKKKAWQEVAQCFNQLNSKERALAELKQQWRTMKIDAKKCNSDYKRALKTTGGGMKPPSPDLNVIEIFEMLPLEFEEGINKFDSDNINQENQADLNIEIQDEDNVQKKKEEVETIPVVVNTQESQHYSQGTPVNKVESVQSKSCRRNILESISNLKSSRRKRCNMIEVSQEPENRQKRDVALISLMKTEHELKMQQMIEAHAWAQEEHNLRVRNLQLQNRILEKQLE